MFDFSLQFICAQAGSSNGALAKHVKGNKQTVS